jgi:type IV pilus assembly protein PilX
MLVVVALLGMSGAHIALQGEKASRNERDRRVAFQAAEAALADAELDIENSPDPARSRSGIFSRTSTEGFTAGCGAGDDNGYLGLCSSADGTSPAWLTVDFLEVGATARSVPYGRFTGQEFPAGKGPLPARPPRYIIELLAYNKPGEVADREGMGYVYRITAVGFGMRESTQVALQTIYRKGGR